MSAFEWNPKKEKAALLLAKGHTQQETAKQIEVTDRTIRRWLEDIDFQAEIDRLSLMVDVAGRAERLRIAMRVVRQKVSDKYVLTDKDLLDWLKFAQSETDGIKLDLAALTEAATSLADE